MNASSALSSAALIPRRLLHSNAELANHSLGGLSQHRAQHLAIGGSTGQIVHIACVLGYRTRALTSGGCPSGARGEQKKRFMKKIIGRHVTKALLIQPTAPGRDDCSRIMSYKRMRLFSRIRRSLQGREGQCFGGLICTRFCSSDLVVSVALEQFLACDYVSSPPPPDADATRQDTPRRRRCRRWTMGPRRSVCCP